MGNDENREKSGQQGESEQQKYNRVDQPGQTNQKPPIGDSDNQARDQEKQAPGYGQEGQHPGEGSGQEREDELPDEKIA